MVRPLKAINLIHRMMGEIAGKDEIKLIGRCRKDGVNRINNAIWQPPAIVAPSQNIESRISRVISLWQSPADKPF
jgi:hypothetical protein